MKIEIKERKKCFFSIVIASYNDLDNLIDCIASINAQSFKNYEVLVSDGGSSDGTLDYIKSGIIDKLSWYKSSADEGIYDALNIAFNHISGKWVLVLGADDSLIDSSALARAHQNLNWLGANIGIAYSDIYIKYDYGVVLKRYPEFDEFEIEYNGGAFIHHQSAFILSSAICLVGKFSSEFKIHSDYDMILRVLKISTAFKIKDSFVTYNAHGFSSKLNNLIRSFCEVRTIRKSHGYSSAPMRLLKTFAGSMVRVFFRFLKI